MAKKIIEKKIRAKKLAKESIQKKPLIPEKYQDLAFISLIVISVFAFLSGAVFGGGFISSDNLASISFRPYVDNAAESGSFPLWMPYIFGGMPSFGALLTTGERLWDFIPEIIFGLSELLRTLFGSDSARIAFFYALYGVGMYLLMRTKDQERFVAFFTAFAAVFSTSVIVWIMIGHNTKPVVFAMFPFIIMFLEKLRVKFSLLHLAGLTIALHLMMEASHIQMIFYAGCTAGLYLLFELVSRLIRKKEPMKILKTAGFLVIAAGIAFMMSSDRYLSIMEYTPYSTRGSAPIMQTDSKHQDASGGNDYDYATMWSFSPNEMMNFFVPSYHGFGKVKYTGRATGNRETVIPTYWGQKPIEDAAPYMGIAVIGLALFGFIRNRKNIFVQFLMALSLFSLFLSFGYTFPLLYDLFYNYVPTFNKFRAPSMALAMMQFAVPIMAGFGISSIVAMKKEMSSSDKKLLYVGMGAAAGFLLIGVLYSLTGEASYMNGVDASNLTGRYPQEIKDFIWSNAVNDWMIGGFLALAVALTAFAFVKGKLKKTAMFTVFTIILVADLWRVDVRPMEYSDKPVESESFKTLDYYEFLKKDEAVFRIADFQANPANIPAYYGLENINGYHSAKLRIFQDLSDVCGSGSTSHLTNPFLWKLMNVKYVVYPQAAKGYTPVFQSNTGVVVYRNPGLPRTFFVGKAVKADQMEILNHIKNSDFNPEELAYVEKDLPLVIDMPSAGANSEIVDKSNEFIKIKATATGNNLLFVSEMHYPACWHAYIDGKETEIYKTNFAFRSIIVPAGTHDIEMKFISDNFELGKSLSLAGNIIVVLAVAGGIVLRRRKKTVNKQDTV